MEKLRPELSEKSLILLLGNIYMYLQICNLEGHIFCYMVILGEPLTLNSLVSFYSYISAFIHEINPQLLLFTHTVLPIRMAFCLLNVSELLWLSLWNGQAMVKQAVLMPYMRYLRNNWESGHNSAIKRVKGYKGFFHLQHQWH